MANKLGARQGKVRAFGLVRDKAGKPKIDNIQGIPRPIWDLLTEGEKQEIKDRDGYPSN